ncbi:amino acid ABC transporter permease [bacterium]|nr:amino acid ABC transporter permease [bacterium]MCB2179325.1 amino acid ABC transporter permease [bacterium]
MSEHYEEESKDDLPLSDQQANNANWILYAQLIGILSLLFIFTNNSIVSGVSGLFGGLSSTGIKLFLIAVWIGLFIWFVRKHPQEMQTIPWWAVVVGVIGVYFVILAFTNPYYQDTMKILIEGRPTATALEGMLLTIRITLLSFAFAVTIGLFTGLARVSKNVILNNIATFYVEVIRGMPLVVLMLYVAFVLLPIFVNAFNWLGDSLQIAWLSDMSLRNISFESRAIAALSIGFGAYEAEVFRAGIISIERGQMEAARSLGMNYLQAMRYVILPQAIRRVLPPLGNDFIALLKDSSLATVLAVPELTQLGRVQRSSTFRVFEVFNSVAFLYLTMTLILSFLVRMLERRLNSDSYDEAIR